MLAPLDAVPLTLSPTAPSVLLPFRERDVDRARVALDELRGELFPREEDDRALEERREPEVLREVEVFRALVDVLRAFEVFRAFEAVFVPLLRLLVPFLDVALERLEVLRRRLVLAFACAI